MNSLQLVPDPTKTVDPAIGYKLASEIYDRWHWQEFWRRNELPIVQRWLSSLNPGIALDAGTGTGLYSFAIERSGHRGVGIDISKEMLRVQQRGGHQAALVQGSLTALPFSNSSFDYALSTRVLTHIPALLSAFTEIARVLRPGGKLFLADIHPEHPYSKMSIKADRQKVSIRIHKYSIEQLRNSIAAAGLDVIGFRSYGLENLSWRPPHDGFKNIYRDPTRPIFYTAWILRH